MVVKLSTKPGPDNPACVVAPREHPAISMQSYVRCEEAGVGTLAALKQGLAVGFVSISQVVSGAMLQRVQKALVASRYSKGAVKNVLRQQGFG